MIFAYTVIVFAVAFFAAYRAYVTEAKGYKMGEAISTFFLFFLVGVGIAAIFALLIITYVFSFGTLK